MPTNRFGQLITFATEIDADQTFSQYVWWTCVKGDTCARIAAKHGHPEEARTIADLNKIRSVTEQLKPGRRIRIPGDMRQGDAFRVLPQDMKRPTVIDGYALYQNVPRVGSVGVNQFVGYDPLVLQVPIHFITAPALGGSKAYTAQDIENDINILEKMAGRGNYRGAASGAPSVIRISVTDDNGNVVPLVPTNYQWTRQNTSAPLWRIGSTSGGSTVGIQWDDGARSDAQGRRIDAKCVVTLSQYTPISLTDRSSSNRSRRRNRSKWTGAPVGIPQAVIDNVNRWGGF